MKLTREDMGIVEATSRAGELTARTLQNVRVEPGKLVATEGHFLVIREVEMEEDEETFKPYLVNGKSLKSCVKKASLLHAGDKKKAVVLGVAGVVGSILNGQETTLPKADGTYPDYAKVLPAKKRKGQVSFILDRGYLMRLLKGMADVDDVVVNVVDHESAVRFDGTTNDGRKVTAVLMPRVGD